MGVEYGDVVKVNYVGKLEDGTIFDTSLEKVAMDAGILIPDKKYEPLVVVVGAKDVIKGFEETLVGMEKDEVKEVKIPPEKAFGFRNPELVKKYSKALFEQSNVEPIEGMRITTPEGHATISKVAEDYVEVDFNHPLAGKTLIFEIKVEDIVAKK
ncbi:MAG: peptidylprolyl isomerase [Candidatus Hydrothermarchaeota archaeon]